MTTTARTLTVPAHSLRAGDVIHADLDQGYDIVVTRVELAPAKGEVYVTVTTPFTRPETGIFPYNSQETIRRQG
jgi:hypothetical protein